MLLFVAKVSNKNRFDQTLAAFLNDFLYPKLYIFCGNLFR